MRHIIVLLWAIIIGQIAGYLGAALNHSVYSFPEALIGSIVIALIVIIIGEVSQPKKKSPSN